VTSGARRGELLGASWLGFSAEQATWTISQQVTPTRVGVTIAPPKTKRSHRTVRLDADTVAALEAHRERQLAEREAAAHAYEDRDLIFADELGRPIARTGSPRSSANCASERRSGPVGCTT
jgi:integrase